MFADVLPFGARGSGNYGSPCILKMFKKLLVHSVTKADLLFKSRKSEPKAAASQWWHSGSRGEGKSCEGGLK